MGVETPERGMKCCFEASVSGSAASACRTAAASGELPRGEH